MKQRDVIRSFIKYEQFVRFAIVKNQTGPNFKLPLTSFLIRLNPVCKIKRSENSLSVPVVFTLFPDKIMLANSFCRNDYAYVKKGGK